jgi:hypothetical protein
LIIGIGVALVLGAGLIFWRAQRPKTNMATLADGTQIIVHAVTYGTKHNFVHGSKLLLKAQPFLPPFMSRMFPAPFTAMTIFREERLLVWYSFYNPTDRKYLSLQVDSFSVIDEHGCTFPVREYSGQSSTPTFSVASAVLQVFPRRQKTFTFRAKLANQPAVDLQIANPLYPIAAQWSPEPLPATRKTNNLEVTLKGLEYKDQEKTYVAGDFEIYDAGVRRSDWYSRGLTFSDATGNSNRNPLCPYELAWKVDLDLWKNELATFPEEEIWRFPKIGPPPPGELQRLDQKRQLGHLLVTVVALCGPGEYVFSNDVCVSSARWESDWDETFSNSSSGSGPRRDIRMEFRRKSPTLVVDVSGWRTSSELRVRTRSADGRPQPVFFRGSGEYLWTFDMPRLTNTCDLELMAQTPVLLQFIAPPPRPVR